MEYTIKEFAQLAHVSTRTLRYYDQIGLLKPSRLNESGYRIYGKKEVDLLQQILFYRELNFSLKAINEIIYAHDFNLLSALESHLDRLKSERKRVDLLISTLEKTINEKKGGEKMKDNEKFTAFKEKLVNDNEKKYGQEIRKKYDENAINKANEKLKGMSEEDFNKISKIENDLFKVLKEAFEEGNPKSDLARRAAKLHQEWISFYWHQYNKDAHKGLVEMYVEDERFTAYYDKIAPGVTKFLRDAVLNYLGI